jgi:hypothetical protein
MIKLQILLRREWRTTQGVEEARKSLASAGLTPTAVGLATISAEMESQRFEELFGLKALQVEGNPPGAQNSGESGIQESPDLKIPESLLRYVQGITIAPPHLYMNE